MSRIFVCGDLHGRSEDMKKLTSKKWKMQHELNKNDFLIQLGDFGLVWYDITNPKFKEDMYYRNWLSDKNYTTLFLDGNHENHDLLNNLEIESKFGGKVGLVNTKYGNIYHLKRGEIYTINNKKFLIIGGAETQFKGVECKEWWKNEILSNEDKKNILDNLKKHDFKVDFVLSHNCPLSVGNEMASKKFGGGWSFSEKEFEKYFFKSNDSVAIFMEFLLKEGLSAKEWHFGHWHEDVKLKINEITYYCHYNNIPLELI